MVVKTKVKPCIHYPDSNFSIYNLSPMSLYGVRMPSLRNYSAWVMLDPHGLELLDTTQLSRVGVDILSGNIPDFNIPRVDQMDKIIDFIELYEYDDKPILLTCIGAHGRTGMVLSIQAGLNGRKDPIKYIRDIYCDKAVETPQQEEFVYDYLDLPVPDDVYVRMSQYEDYLDALLFIKNDEDQMKLSDPFYYSKP